jgi:hypothetical protein
MAGARRGQSIGGDQLSARSANRATEERGVLGVGRLFRGDARENEGDAGDRRHAEADQGDEAAARVISSSARLWYRGFATEFGRSLRGRGRGRGRLQRVLDCGRVLSPEGLGPWGKPGLRTRPGLGSIPAVRIRSGRGTEWNELVCRTEPVERKLQHVALGPSFVAAVLWLLTFRFHGVCRPFVADRADYVLGRR